MVSNMKLFIGTVVSLKLMLVFFKKVHLSLGFQNVFARRTVYIICIVSNSQFPLFTQYISRNRSFVLLADDTSL